jgi:hypothetical protein
MDYHEKVIVISLLIGSGVVFFASIMTLIKN